jgi:hypothetical protein
MSRRASVADAEPLQDRSLGDAHRRRFERRQRSGLHDEQLIADECPLDVLGAAVVAFDVQPETGDLDHLVVGQHATPTVAFRQVLEQVAVRATRDPDRLTPDPDIAQHLGRPVDVVGVGLDPTGHDDFAEPERRLDHDLTALGRVDGEHHTRSIRRDHLLDDDGDGGFVEQLAVDPIRRNPLTEQRRPAVGDASEEVRPAHVGERLVHAGERGVGRVLGGCRGAHGHPDVRTQRVQSFHHLVGELGDEGRRSHRLAESPDLDGELLRRE